MSLPGILQGLKQGYWPDDPGALLQHQGKYALTKQEMKWLVQEANAWLQAGKEGKATNYLYAGLLLDTQRFLKQVQKEGILRISRYDYEERPVTRVIEALLKPGLGVQPEVLAYLQNLATLQRIAVEIRRMYQDLLQWMQDERETGLKSLLATLDLIFLLKAKDGRSGVKVEVASDHPFFFGPEELAEGFSTILAVYTEKFGPPTHNSKINRRFAGLNLYSHLLNQGAHLAVFREWEILIDRFGYRVSLDSIGAFRIDAPSHELGRAVRLGFMHTELQRIVKGADWYDPDAPVLREWAEKAAEITADISVQRVKKPVERLVFGVPDIPPIRELINDGRLFLEERMALLAACRDLMTPLEKLLETQVAEKVTLHDLMKVQRLVQFTRWFTAKHLLPMVQKEFPVVLESIVPHYQPGKLQEVFSVAVSVEKAEQIANLLTLDLNRSSHIDIQYQPIVPSGEGLLLPTNVFANSNLLRNVLHLTRRRLYEDGRDDPLPEGLVKLFDGQKHLARGHVNYSYQKEKGEIDVLVLVDNILFALECKNSLIPTGPHELLTSYDYIQTAAEQLNRFQNAFQDLSFRELFAKERKLPIDHSTHLVTGIIMSNRMLMGYRIDGHPVRGVYEIEQFVQEGTVCMGKEEKCFWKGPSMSGNDLRCYFEDDITYKPMWAAMRQYDERYKIGRRMVAVEGFRLGMLELAQSLGFSNTEEVLKPLVAQEEARLRKALQEIPKVK